MTTMSDIQQSINAGTLTGIVVEVTFPDTEFGGVLIKQPAEIPVQVVICTGGDGGGGEAPSTNLVTSVFGRLGDVVGADGDYTLDKIDPPLANWVLPNKLRLKADGSFQLWNPDQSKWHTLEVRGSAGAEFITISAGED